MPYSLQITGMDELGKTLQKLGTAARGVAAVGVFDGAGIIADAVSSAVQGIVTEPFHYAKNGEKRKPSPEEKAMLEAAPKGIAKFRKDAFSVNTSIGFSRSGYAAITWNHARTGTRTKYKINGQGMAIRSGSAKGGTSAKPIPVIANAINSGTSFMEKQPFFRNAVKKSEAKALAAIGSKIIERFDQITK